mmetsp:Transcript_23995/g.43399  ORF Transcript_23995/g.43399 Transcript_23995/m.43399 type:complete len:81 (-) Transcript_23995:606-848(-)
MSSSQSMASKNDERKTETSISSKGVKKDQEQDHESVMMDESLSHRDKKVEEYYMLQALKVAKAAVVVGVRTRDNRLESET